MLRIPHFLDNRLVEGGKVVSHKHRPRSTPEGLGKLRNSIISSGIFGIKVALTVRRSVKRLWSRDCVTCFMGLCLSVGVLLSCREWLSPRRLHVYANAPRRLIRFKWFSRGRSIQMRLALPANEERGKTADGIQVVSKRALQLWKLV
jgi:hypothetical protein